MSNSESSTDSLEVLSAQPQLRAILDRGAREGKVSYQFINETLGDLPVDDDASEALFEVLENRGIQVVDEPEVRPASKGAGQGVPGASVGATATDGVATDGSAVDAPSPAPSAPARKARKKSAHSDLDDVLASLEDLINSPFGELLARDDAASEGQGEEEEVSTGELEDSYTQYMNRMGRVALLEEDEERALARQLRDGSEAEAAAAKQKLVEANLRLVVSIAQKYAKRASMPVIDLVQEGNLGLIRAVERWNPERSVRLASYATWYIRDSINHAIAAQSRSIRLPGHLAAAMQKLQRLQRELAQKLGRAPFDAELAEAAGMTPEQVNQIMRLVAEPLSFETPLGDDENSTIGDVIAGDDADAPIEGISRGEISKAIAHALETLSERERAVVSQRFGIGDYASAGARTVDDVAKTMHLSRDRVRELEVRALRKMRRRTRGTPLEDLFGVPGDED